jgi:hypothetical protein
MRALIHPIDQDPRTVRGTSERVARHSTDQRPSRLSDDPADEAKIQSTEQRPSRLSDDPADEAKIQSTDQRPSRLSKDPVDRAKTQSNERTLCRPTKNSLHTLLCKLHTVMITRKKLQHCNELFKSARRARRQQRRRTLFSARVWWTGNRSS